MKIIRYSFTQSHTAMSPNSDKAHEARGPPARRVRLFDNAWYPLVRYAPVRMAIPATESQWPALIGRSSSFTVGARASRTTPSRRGASGFNFINWQIHQLVGLRQSRYSCTSFGRISGRRQSGRYHVNRAFLDQNSLALESRQFFANGLFVYAANRSRLTLSV